ncbi:F-box/kelch-repeat protein At3g06240-like [Rhodamnia argentea]|uniref:F-box/kelch-repeat protein At3g06240-like n=1 Tax=Rhodamnia argentea TaxID=178133 RepID=A0ABM3GUL6_9MYRT|nr:F-box/kelch-repeat protein At3g06240-like [Rhodamnia argentea]
MSSSDDPNIPQDVVVEILKRLPVESLLRFRCVSRSWRSAIDDPRFVALHLNHSALDASNWHLLCLHRFDPVQRLCSLFPNVSLALPSQSQIEIPFGNPANQCSFVGSCNGLICVREFSTNGPGETFYLWNLFTRKHKAVPRSGLKHQYLSAVTLHRVLGFGFDAGSNDYKIVRIFYVLEDSGGCLGGPKARVEIYSLSTDSWRSLEWEVPAFCGYRTAVFFNGKLHSFAFKFDGPWGKCADGLIVSFDVAGEVFDEIALPEEIQKDSGRLIVSVAVLSDLLAVFTSRCGDAYADPKPQSVCSIWVMRDYGVPKSWTKLYNFEARGMVIGFGGFTCNGELLMEIHSGEPFSWNLITRQFTNLPLLETCDWVTIAESLVKL